MFHLCAILLSLFCFKETQSAERQLDAHDHGYGNLNIAIINQTVAIELDTPAYNIIGFEHPPETVEDKTTFKKALSILNNGSNLFIFPTAADCTLKDVNISSSLIEDQRSSHKEHEHGHKKHDSGHKEHEHDHKGSKHEDHSKNNVHSEFHADYKFTCNEIGKANSIQVMVFKHFPNTRQLNVQIVLPHKQSAIKLTPTSTQLNF